MYFFTHLLYLFMRSNFIFFNFLKFIYLFLAALGLHCCAPAFASCGKRGLIFVWCTGFSLWWLLLLRSMGSRRTGFSSCGIRAQQLWLAGLVVPWHVGSSRPRAQTHVPCIGRHILNHCATREVP